MTFVIPQTSTTTIRSAQLQDLELIEQLFMEAAVAEAPDGADRVARQFQMIRQWYGILKLLSLFPNPFRDVFSAYVAEQMGYVRGAVQVSPFNRTRSTWRVDQVAVDHKFCGQAVASLLLRHCFEAIWEARTWLVEANVNNKDVLALYRQNGFQPLAQFTYWTIAPERLQSLANREPDLPNLLPVSNADAQLLYQLDTASMPPQVRQVFDRHSHDFRTNLFHALVNGIRDWFNRQTVVSSYVFETQRKAAIGYFQLRICKDGSQPHVAQLTVHPAYTWLYPELVTQMAQVTQPFPAQSIQLVSADYQPEREAYLEQIGAGRVAHTLLMSRSVWHKLRESKAVSLEGLQLSGMLRGFQPSQKPVPGRIDAHPTENQSLFRDDNSPNLHSS